MATLSGDAGQRVLVAWSMGWEPAIAASQPGWMAPYLGLLLDDPYDVVRYVAQRSLRSQPGFAKFNFDYLCTPTESSKAKLQVLHAWEAKRGAGNGASGPGLMIHPEMGILHDEVNRLLKARDHRPVNLAE